MNFNNNKYTWNIILKHLNSKTIVDCALMLHDFTKLAYKRNN